MLARRPHPGQCCLFTAEVMMGVDRLIAAVEARVMADEPPMRRVVRSGPDAVARNARIARDIGRVVAIVVNTHVRPEEDEFGLGRQAFLMGGYGKLRWTEQRLDTMVAFLEGPPLMRRVEVRYGATAENMRWARAMGRRRRKT